MSIPTAPSSFPDSKTSCVHPRSDATFPTLPTRNMDLKNVKKKNTKNKFKKKKKISHPALSVFSARGQRNLHAAWRKDEETNVLLIAL